MSDKSITNIPQLAVECILAGIRAGTIRFIPEENVAVDRPRKNDWTGEGLVLVSEDISTGTGQQRGIGPVRTPLAVRAYAGSRDEAELLCREATKAVLKGIARLMRRGFGIHGVFQDVARTEAKKSPLYNGGGNRNEQVAVRFLIVINSINSL